MRKERVEQLIDSNIIRQFSEGFTLICIINELKKRCQNLQDVLIKDKVDLKPIYPSLVSDVNVAELPGVSKRLIYFVFYVKHANKRIQDIQWIILNKKRFPLKSNSEIFKLLGLKEHLLNNKYESPF